MKIKVAINGFGRIGRAVFKIILDKHPDMEVVAINDLSDVGTLAHLLKYDSVYGRYGRDVRGGRNKLKVDNKNYPILAERDPADLPWGKKKVDVVFECTGLFRTRETACAHLDAGAGKVLISAPAKSDDIKTIVPGVNDKDIKEDDDILSMASCTTNCLAPATEVIRSNFGIKKAIMTTIHSYTSTQNLVDGPHKDLRRARAAGVNMVPTSTGAAIATTKTIPELEGKFDGMAVRVPTPVGSMCDIVYITNKKTTEDKVNKAFKRAARQKAMKGILEVSEELIVQSDIVGNPASSIVDLPLTKVIEGDMVKVIAWYDNEMGYSNRLAELANSLKK
jgi:glyceraldehyde 3-phosphate dehydrogenase